MKVTKNDRIDHALFMIMALTANLKEAKAKENESQIELYTALIEGFRKDIKLLTKKKK